MQGMTGKSPLSATEEQRAGLIVLAGSRVRGEADRARAILLTLTGRTSPRITEAFGGAKTQSACGAACQSALTRDRR